MKFVCEKCGEQFDTEKQCHNHEMAHIKAETPAIDDKLFVAEYYVMEKDYDDYACCKLQDINTGRVLIDGAVYNAIANTNINDLEKLVGKKIRITSFAEII